jgi:hypothetical protein
MADRPSAGPGPVHSRGHSAIDGLSGHWSRLRWRPLGRTCPCRLDTSGLWHRSRHHSSLWRRCRAIDGQSGPVRLLCLGWQWNRNRSREGRLNRYEKGVWRWLLTTSNDLGRVERGRNASRLHSRPRCEGHDRSAGLSWFKINNGPPPRRSSFCRNCLLLLEIPAQRLSRQGSTCPGWIGET